MPKGKITILAVEMLPNIIGEASVDVSLKFVIESELPAGSNIEISSELPFKVSNNDCYFNRLYSEISITVSLIVIKTSFLIEGGAELILYCDALADVP